MKITGWFLWLMMGLSWGVSAQNNPLTISTVYEDGEFITTARLTVKASMPEIQAVVDSFVAQYNHRVNRLFPWALKGLKLKGEADDFIEFNIKSHTYDPASRQIAGKMDINVAFLNRNHPGINYTTRLSQQVLKNGVRTFRYQMLRCDKVIKHIEALFTMEEKAGGEAVVQFKAKVSLQGIYTMMTLKQYQENIEWRIGKLLTNLGNAGSARRER